MCGWLLGNFFARDLPVAPFFARNLPVALAKTNH